MNCSAVKEKLDRWVDRETDSEETGALESHVEGCSSCKEIVEGEKAFRKLLQVRLTERAPSELVERVRGKIAHPTSFWRRNLIPAIAAMLLVGVIGMIVFRNTDSMTAHTLAQNAIHKHGKVVEDPHTLDALLCAADCCTEEAVKSLANFYQKRLSFKPCRHDLSHLGYEEAHGSVWEIRPGKNASWTTHQNETSGGEISHVAISGMDLTHAGGEEVSDGGRMYKKHQEEVVLIFPDKNGVSCVFIFDSLEEARRYLNSRGTQ